MARIVRRYRHIQPWRTVGITLVLVLAACRVVLETRCLTHWPSWAPSPWVGGGNSAVGTASHRKSQGTILIRVRVPGEAGDFSPRASFQCRLCYGVSTTSMCNCMHQLCAILLFGHTQILYTLVGMGSAALAAAVPVRRPELSKGTAPITKKQN